MSGNRSDTGHPVFLSTPSARRATGTDGRIGMYVEISIHALREEGDNAAHITPSGGLNFYPRPPRGGRPVCFDDVAILQDISIHALREEGDPSTAITNHPQGNFYPRPPRGGRPQADRPVQGPRHFYPRPPRGGRPAPMAASGCTSRFLSTPSARRATTRRTLRQAED